MNQNYRAILLMLIKRIILVAKFADKIEILTSYKNNKKALQILQKINKNTSL